MQGFEFHISKAIVSNSDTGMLF